ncbi:hypothetical protein [Salirhabdus salicampi]|uniref:hypothetical protein n=1 Tax=Salirhabdus salicampi TaxID=476102 RepID=UPI0020C39E75|nr:hypothetical protein [Salirhabdus salicampi]MCP8617112.1 hypothetical protein [Salirhabdus salicampi]
MNRNALLRLLFSLYLLYLALPAMQNTTGNVSSLFWGCWLLFFLCVAGGNLWDLLMTEGERKKQEKVRKRIFAKQN